MDGRQRSVVTGIHRLQHVERLFTAHLSDDDAIGAHTKGVDDELALANGAFPFHVGRPRLQAHDVLLTQLQFRRVLDGDDALAFGNKTRQHVQQRRLAGAGAAADEAVEACAHAVREEVEHRTGQRAQRHEILGLEPFGRKAANRDDRAVHRQRRNDRVDARAVGQSRVDHWRAVVDPAADRAHDPIDDAHQMAIVLELGRDALQLAGALHEHVLVRVDENIADGRVAQQRLQRPQPEHVVEQLDEQPLALAEAERRAFFGEQLTEHGPYLALGARTIRLRQRLEVQAVEQLAMDVGLELHVSRARSRQLGP